MHKLIHTKLIESSLNQNLAKVFFCSFINFSAILSKAEMLRYNSIHTRLHYTTINNSIVNQNGVVCGHAVHSSIL